MTFSVYADGTANLPGSLLNGITLLPSEYTVNGETHTYTGNIESFDVHAYYESLRNGADVKTSLQKNTRNVSSISLIHMAAGLAMACLR